LPARVLEISEETAVIVKDADGPGFNIGKENLESGRGGWAVAFLFS
jgi:hypothetical protein